MARASAPDLRDRVLAAAHEETLSYARLAAQFRVGESTVRSWLRRERTTGSACAKRHAGGARPTLAAAGVAVLQALLAERNDRTLQELADGVHARLGVARSRMAVWRACRRLDLRRKKKEPRPRRADA